MEWPLLEDGDRRFRIDDDKYLNQLEGLAAAVHEEFAKVAGPRTVWTCGRITLEQGAPSIVPVSLSMAAFHEPPTLPCTTRTACPRRSRPGRS